MGGTVELPIWLVVLALALAAIGALDRVLAPSMRWFLRKRMERAVARLNTRLQRPIEPFKLMARQDRINRLVYDPVVTEAVADHAHETGVPEPVAAEEARRYAREIVPGFSTLIYFGVAARVTRWLSRALYRVRIGRLDTAAIAAIDPKATVIFVMNHRSNMDYILVTWLSSERSTLSYAVGEWARVWPLSLLIRAMGAYFIRRRSRNTLYRKVLARYVQMATAEGVTQAIFPEGGLSLDGRVGPSRMGLLHYIVSGFSPGGGRDVVFMPVAFGYDRVLEDRILVSAAQSGERRFRARPLAALRFLIRRLVGAVFRRDMRLGYAAVSFGAPLSLSRFLAETGSPTTEALTERLMQEVRQVVPILPVPLAAAALAAGATTRDTLEDRACEIAERLRSHGAPLRLPGADPAVGARMGLDALARRGLVRVRGNTVTPRRRAAPLLAFYAAPVQQHLDAAAANARPGTEPSPISATSET
ncbi:glycerol-3-phosphate O-acyltransferase [Defluviimonas sp. 20V17]|uniref:Glycerol-3-phosphate acyltransferase n=1 Tax=Allgaiera indica TaxID=765699 RepID=A0AAN4ZY40_9RHOB|nr:1-acyl-sn-glycerol-3-phosphate acyltransferase [Allgaiera indica]KDB04315.1 glycerol-3-phosphate O-acyltransferase [Defluviimonas sp. 20V17]GHD99539.1 glycerol-3-phosphate 1-O-acyltransferase [Allgaiera indica]SDW23517.1 glycerol-3-phosphate acyltransferase [Allgaiera indica]